MQYFWQKKTVVEYALLQYLHILSSLLKGINKIGTGLDFNFDVGSKWSLFAVVSSITLMLCFKDGHISVNSAGIYKLSIITMHYHSIELKQFLKEWIDRILLNKEKFFFF